MNKKVFMLVAPLAFLAASCMNYTIHHATNNTIGAKSGTAKVGMFTKDSDFSYNSAAKKGGVNKIGTTEIRKGTLSIKTTVTGE